ncbi:hypothetical protein B0T16DRAFT_383844 [Cercophora newfieldiana]|uniref:Secreted protein n=1 Tax=Cercophora newfieldiana TaxID=92897 RepID=A0AA39YPF7_9PEZI|nr:hypothetical protein B0T16DRAFT_383844 [Cercophora newfieldiana]
MMQTINMCRFFLLLAGIMILDLTSSVVASLVKGDDRSVSIPRSSSQYLAQRSAPVPQMSGPPVCGQFNTGDKKDFEQLQYDMSGDKSNVTTPAKKCRRQRCKNTTGVYVCNDNDHDVIIPYLTIREFAAKPGKECCTKRYTDSKGISGQQFSDQNWNVIIAYANCNHPQDQDRPGFGPAGDPWGPNGACEN